ncbi:MAG TPA: asparagine synthase-related protein, partial [Syntrophales bacterium]|nr:asparagine synthase-related protein [Syntrophales bacterium]
LLNPPQTLQIPLSPYLSPQMQSLAYQALRRIPYAIEAVKKVIALTARIRPTRKEIRPWYESFDPMMSHFSLNERTALLGGNSDLSNVDYYASRFPYPTADSPVAAAQYLDFKSYLPGDILVKVDRMSMANSLETRSALLDYRIAELAFSMPTSIKLPEPLWDGSKNKFILKELASHYLGREYTYRPKEGFGIPIDQWLREDKEHYLHDTLLNNISPIYDHLNRGIVQNIVKAHLDKRMACGHKVWNLLMLDGWLRYVHNANTVSSLKND